jgi:diguanylate cyclase (GGDEF)-like protein/PAS domain S-box-containing protein
MDNDFSDFYKDLLDNLHEGVYFVDTDRRITYWNKSAEEITGYSAAFAVGKHCRDNFLNHITENGVELCNTQCPLAATMQDGKKREAEVYLHHVDGYRVPVVVRASPIYDKNGTVVGAVETFSNNSLLINTRRRAQNMQAAALLDPLTGVGNRRQLEAHIKSELVRFHETDVPFGLMFCDVDHFKTFNDTYGHEVGDKVLRMVAQTLQGNVRGTDAVGRWGGEEFIVIADNLDLPRLQSLAEKLCNLISRSRMDMEARSLSVTISIGATLAKPDDTMHSLTARADKLMYQSKAAGRNRVECG